MLTVKITKCLHIALFLSITFIILFSLNIHFIDDDIMLNDIMMINENSIDISIPNLNILNQMIIVKENDCAYLFQIGQYETCHLMLLRDPITTMDCHWNNKIIIKWLTLDTKRKNFFNRQQQCNLRLMKYVNETIINDITKLVLSEINECYINNNYVANIVEIMRNTNSLWTVTSSQIANLYKEKVLNKCDVDIDIAVNFPIKIFYHKIQSNFIIFLEPLGCRIIFKTKSGLLTNKQIFDIEHDIPNNKISNFGDLNIIDYTEQKQYLLNTYNTTSSPIDWNPISQSFIYIKQDDLLNLDRILLNYINNDYL
jgi:hypothetical protein